MEKLNWASTKPGYIVDCMLMSADAKIFDIVTFKFLLEESEKMQRLLHAVESFNKIYNKVKEISFEKKISAIAKKSKVEEAEIEDWFDDLLMLSNGDDAPVDNIVGYRVHKTDSHTSGYAMFAGKPYNALQKICPGYFQTWEVV